MLQAQQVLLDPQEKQVTLDPQVLQAPQATQAMLVRLVLQVV